MSGSDHQGPKNYLKIIQSGGLAFNSCKRLAARLGQRTRPPWTTAPSLTPGKKVVVRPRGKRIDSDIRRLSRGKRIDSDMRKWTRYFLSILCALALVGAGPVSFAASVAAAPCVHEHAAAHAGNTASDKHHDADCLSCCLGACVAVPSLPALAAGDMVTFAALPVTYQEIAVSFSSRSIAPDLGPPRSVT